MCDDGEESQEWGGMFTWEGRAHSVLRVLGLPVAGHDVALLCANHELGWPSLRIVLQAIAYTMHV